MQETLPRAISEIAKTGATVATDEPMARHTTFKIGGPADVLTVARTTEQLVEILNICRELQVPFFLLGAGSNILVSDQGIRGIVIKNKSSEFLLDDELVWVDSGYLMPKFVLDISKCGRTGCEFIQSIPGTIGGGTKQNVRFRNAKQFGQYDGLIETKGTDLYFSKLITDVELVTDRGERKILANSECGFTYTGIAPSELAGESPVIVRVHLKLQRDSADAVRERLHQYRTWRAQRTAIFSETEIAQPEDGFTGTRARQPVGATAGCVFFNVPNQHNHPTGRLIDLCGLRGHRVGNAEISPAHANYIVNLGGAKAIEVRTLMELAKEKVFSRFGVELMEEIEFVGEWKG